MAGRDICPQEAKGVKTPKVCDCGKRGQCYETRGTANWIYRRYRCSCGQRWTTYELRKKDVEKV